MSEALERAARLKTKSELLADKIRKLTEQQKAFETEITELELSDVKQSANAHGIDIEDAPTAIEIYSVGKKSGLTREEMIEALNQASENKKTKNPENNGEEDNIDGQIQIF